MRGKKRLILFTNIIACLTVFLFFACRRGAKQNRLQQASSPYLQQHADNPVDWYEWGDEALEKAKKENKPLLISIGYASCHWCHVMEKESFMDEELAAIMNKNFICIKVDREERPDIDAVYMNACQLLTGGKGGWPLNAFALPDGKPFFAGPYYKKNNWKKLLQQVSTAYKEQNKKVVLQALSLANEIAKNELQFLPPDDEEVKISRDRYSVFFDSLYARLDLANGGLKGQVKFPMAIAGEFLLQYHYFTGDKKALDALNTSLSKMAAGGIYDHIGGGFARYSTDSLWRVPHFEKMLCDNAQLMSLYAHAAQVTQNELYKQVTEEIASFAKRELLAPNGGFYSSVNAGNEEEGSYYVWNYNDVVNILGENEGKQVASYYNITPAGNWKNGNNILYTTFTPGEFAIKNQLSSGFTSTLASARKKLTNARNKREKPHIDDKILVSWNALMLKGFLDAFAATGKTDYLQTAIGTAAFLQKNMLQANGQLWRSYQGGKTSIPGFLDDYALLSSAYIKLYQHTFNKHWLLLARKITDYAIKNFYDEKKGIFNYTENRSKEIVARLTDLHDNVIPSSNAVMAETLCRLGVFFDEGNYLQIGRQMIHRITFINNINIPSFTYWHNLAGLLANETAEVVIMGKDALQKNTEMQKSYLPDCLFMGAVQEENLPLLEKKWHAGKTLIYVCRKKTCKKPVEDVAQALEQI
jgi:uncharacterized protein